MKMEKEIKGIVKSFSNIEVGIKPKDNSQFAYIDMLLLDHKLPYRLFFDTPEIIQEKVIERVPIGSTVKFIIRQSGKFWNVDLKSFNVLTEGDGSVPKSQKPESLELESQRYIIRQNALSHADSWASLLLSMGNIDDLDKFEETYFEFAKKCEDWITRGD
jgi:hypothetical protein